MNIDKERFDLSEQLMIDSIRSHYPDLDIRRGTAIRDLVIRPQATLSGVMGMETDKAMASYTLQSMKESGVDVNSEDIDRILVNMGSSYRDGTPSSGYVRFIFSTGSSRVIHAGFNISCEGRSFYTADSVTVSSKPGNGLSYDVMTLGNTETYSVPIQVVASDNGASHNLPAGSVFHQTSDKLANLVEIVSTHSFTGGTDPETLDDVIDRLPVALSSRGLTSRDSVSALLGDKYGGSIVAVSLEGLGSATQARNRTLGMSVGGFVDAYIRTFREPVVKVVRKAAVAEDGMYVLDLDVEESAGAYHILSVTDWDGTYSPASVGASSYHFTFDRSLSEDTGGHRIARVDDASLSSYQKVSVTVYDGAALSGDPGDFKIEMYAAPLIYDIQRYCDSPSVRNVGVDFLVKSPVVASITLTAKVYVPEDSDDTAETIRDRCVRYINSHSFVRVFRLSGLLQVIGHKVDMYPGRPVLQMSIRRADGKVINWSGSSDIDLGDVRDPDKYVDTNTVVFAADPRNIHITLAR